MSEIEDKIKAMGYSLPEPFVFPKPNRTGCVVVGSIIYASGHGRNMSGPGVKANALAIFRIARAAEVALRKAGAVSDAASMHSRPSPRNGCGQRSATAPWPGQRPAPPVHHAKKIQRGPRRPRATRANG